jgi:hypothetical protein
MERRRGVDGSVERGHGGGGCGLSQEGNRLTK